MEMEVEVEVEVEMEMEMETETGSGLMGWGTKGTRNWLSAESLILVHDYYLTIPYLPLGEQVRSYNESVRSNQRHQTKMRQECNTSINLSYLNSVQSIP